MNLWDMVMLKLKEAFNTHKADASAHHARYTDAEVDTIVAAHTAIVDAHHPPSKVENFTIFNGVLVANTWTEINVSPYIGTAKKIIFITVIPANNVGIGFRPKGGVDTFSTSIYAGSACFGHVNSSKSGLFVTITDNDGKIEYYSNSAWQTTIQIIGWLS